MTLLRSAQGTCKAICNLVFSFPTITWLRITPVHQCCNLFLRRGLTSFLSYGGSYLLQAHDLWLFRWIYPARIHFRRSSIKALRELRSQLGTPCLLSIRHVIFLRRMVNLMSLSVTTYLMPVFFRRPLSLWSNLVGPLLASTPVTR